MSAEPAAALGVDDVVARAGRWLIAKVWLGCVLSAGYAVGRHFGWPEALLTGAGVLGAVALSMMTLWLPGWTTHHTVGVPLVDVALRVAVWAGLTACVVSLLIGRPAVGAVAGALLINTAVTTFRPRCRPLLRRLHRRHRQPFPRRRADGPPGGRQPARPAASRRTVRASWSGP